MIRRPWGPAESTEGEGGAGCCLRPLLRNFGQVWLLHPVWAHPTPPSPGTALGVRRLPTVFNPLPETG